MKDFEYAVIPQPTSIVYGKGTALSSELRTRETKDDTLGKEGYRLTVAADGITIEGEPAGIFYGIQTLSQLKVQFGESIPCGEIVDKPLFSYRGFMLDCARHFFSVAEIKRHIDMMARLKLNRFHWHLSDDQGWRLEIKELPLLTEIGSKRAQTRCDGTPYGGFYTVSDVQEIVGYCRDRYIEVVPEIDMPGHFVAAISAYPELSCKGEKIKVKESFGISPDIACAGKQGTYEFCYTVLNALCELFPCEYVHLGGDEAVKGNWVQCPNCQKTISENGLKDEEELQGYFMSKMVAYLAQKGKTVINWNDGLLGGNVEGDNLIVQYWKESAACIKAADREAERGRKIIVSPFSKYYLDYPHGMTPLKKTYNYAFPYDKEKILGLEAPLWAEYVEDGDGIEKMAYPRLCAVAERAWSEEFDYEKFLTKCKVFYKILATYITKYEKKPNPGALARLVQVVRFFGHTLDKSFLESGRAFSASKKIVAKKYKK